MTNNQTHTVPTSTHWGNYKIEVTNGRIAAIHPYDEETHPSPISQSLRDSLDPGGRIPQPMVRAGYLQDGWSGGGTGRGAEPFVPVSWERSLDLVAGELARVKQYHGNESIYAGSYGWSSAGTLHRSQSQMQRFLNMIGGFTFHTGSYSFGAAHVILPHIIGALFPILNATPSWQEIAEHADLVVLFGGAPLKNAQIAFGGRGPYSARTGMVAAKASGINFVNISPIRDDVFHEIGAEWIQPIANSDTAVMLALAHTLVIENLYDQSFIADYCVGFDRFPLHLISNRPKTRLHSQWDIGTTSRKSKIKGHEPARMNPQDAADRGLQDRDLIKLFNDRGACNAGVILSENIRPGVVQLSTGAWYNPQVPGQIGSLEVHGNPNVLTRDRGTSQLAQGSTAQTALVQVERYDRPEVEVTVFEQPVTTVGRG